MNAATVRKLVVAALIGNTDAEDRVYSPMDWPTVNAEYPCILVQTPFDHKRSLGRNVPQFNTVTTVLITGRLEAFDSEENENPDGAMKAELRLEVLREQIERAVINSYELTRKTQQFAEVRSQIDVSASGEGHIAQLLMELDIEYYQGPECFYQPFVTQLDVVNTTIPQPEGTLEPGSTITLPTE